MTTDEAARQLRVDRRYSALIHDTYLWKDAIKVTVRFRTSGESAPARKLLSGRVGQATILDRGVHDGVGSLSADR